MRRLGGSGKSVKAEIEKKYRHFHVLAVIGGHLLIKRKKSDVRLLIVDDDGDDFLFFVEAFKELSITYASLFWVRDGSECMSFLHNRALLNQTDKILLLPDMIFLDLNMPEKNGFEVLKEIKSNPEFCHIPVICLTTSNAEKDVYRAYALGANAFIQKPFGWQKFIHSLGILSQFWFETVELPVNQEI